MGQKAGPRYAADSLPPTGYLGWHQWASDMYFIHRATPAACPRCKLWKFPIEQSDIEEDHSSKRDQ